MVFDSLVAVRPSGCLSRPERKIKVEQMVYGLSIIQLPTDSCIPVLRDQLPTNCDLSRD